MRVLQIVIVHATSFRKVHESGRETNRDVPRLNHVGARPLDHPLGQVRQPPRNLDKRQGGGAKGYNPGDRAFVQDGDTVIWVGEKSNERAEALATAVDIETLSLKDVRKKVKK